MHEKRLDQGLGLRQILGSFDAICRIPPLTDRNSKRVCNHEPSSPTKPSDSDGRQQSLRVPSRLTTSEISSERADQLRLVGG